MADRIFLLVDDQRLRLRVPHRDADHAVVESCRCPGCNADPWKVGGTGRRPSKDDRAWEADARCLGCGRPCGIIRFETNTLFGVREDEAVLNGRCRVY